MLHYQTKSQQWVLHTVHNKLSQQDVQLTPGHFLPVPALEGEVGDGKAGLGRLYLEVAVSPDVPGATGAGPQPQLRRGLQELADERLCLRGGAGG